MADEVEVIPREVLFGNPQRFSPRISPDGRRLGFIAPDDGVLNVWLGDIGADLASFAAVTQDRGRGISEFFWARDNRHVLYLQDQGGDENWRLYSVDLDTGALADLTPFEGVQVQVISADPRHPDEWILAINKDNPQLHDPYRLTLSTGELDKICDNPGFVGWLVDAQHRVRGGVAPTPDGGVRIMYRATEADEWDVLVEVAPDDALSIGWAEFDLEGTALRLISSQDANTARLISIDLATRAVSVIAEDPTADVGAVLTKAMTRDLEAVVYVRDRMEWQVLDPSVKADIEALTDPARGDFVPQGRDLADTTWLVAYDLADGPVRYYAWDREARRSTFLFEHRPELTDYSLAPMEPFAFTTSDGLTVHGYVTSPVGVERRSLPTVLNIHGGPWARDMWGFNPEAQWFANRGYLCVQVNYRGSLGYGKDFINAGDREWGGAMHRDVLEALDHAVAQGWTDPARVAIYGGSYGGYESLVCATSDPERFRCAVALCGPSNLITFIESVPEYWKPLLDMFKRRLGDVEADRDFLLERSPLTHVDNVSIPMLIAQGANDPRVKQQESEQFVEALRRKGLDHEYLLVEDEGHGFVRPENRLRFYAMAEQFLAKHLGGRLEA